MGYVRGLRCRACGAEFPAVQLAVCESCFGPLEVTYELSAVRDSFRRADLAGRPRDLWRYREPLPVLDESARVDLAVGCTPLRRAADLGAAQALLAGALRAILLCVEANLQGREEQHPEAAAEHRAIEAQARLLSS